MSIIWILGADDAEMMAIEALLRECSQDVVYAAVSTGILGHRPDAEYVAEYAGQGWRPVRPGEAGSDLGLEVVARGKRRVRPLPCVGSHAWVSGMLAIEVAGPWGEPAIDHHGTAERASWGPDRFLQASSLGQVIERLARMGRIPLSWPRTSADVGEEYEVAFVGGQWVVCAEEFGPLDRGPDEDGPRYNVAVIPTALVFTAAADHCLSAAANGACPGIDPVAFRAAIIRSTDVGGADAALSPEDRIAAVERAMVTLRAAPPAFDLLGEPGISLWRAEALPDGDVYWSSDHTSRVGRQSNFSVRDLTALPVDGPIAAMPDGHTAEQFPAAFPFGPVAASLTGLGYLVRGRRWRRMSPRQLAGATENRIDAAVDAAGGLDSDAGASLWMAWRACAELSSLSEDSDDYRAIAALLPDGPWLPGPYIFRIGGCGEGTWASAEPIRRWLAGVGEARGCLPATATPPDNLYGVPARGFGGGTLS